MSDGFREKLDAMREERDLSVNQENETLRAQVAELKERVLQFQFAPMGDNHHNAAMCPYCGSLLQKAEVEVAWLREAGNGLAEEVSALAATLGRQGDVREAESDTATSLPCMIAWKDALAGKE